MRETFKGLAPDTFIRVTGAGRHSRGVVVRTFDAPTGRLVEYRSAYNGGLRLAPLDRVHAIRKHGHR